MRAPLYKNEKGDTAIHYHGDGTATLETIYDPTPAIERAASLRQVEQRGELRHAMCVPIALYHEWIRTGALGEFSMVNGSPVVDQKALKRLWADYDKLRCRDKL
jgi:hypothetical protein